MVTVLDQVANFIEDKQSFLLEAGAGSGKTWSLIETLKYILNKESETLNKMDQRMVCITYTNIAKDEISERIENNPLVLVSTIHEFLWDVIRNYQTELKRVIVEFNSEQVPGKAVENLDEKLKEVSIGYTQYGRVFEMGNITHDDVLEFSSRLFKTYPKISRITANQYPYIFVDEYQDTESRTVHLLVDDLLAKNHGNLVVGFFGDSKQKIYNQGIGYITSDKLETITKEDNYRCSVEVIKLLNKIRPMLIQTPSGKNVQGEVTFFNCNNDLANQNNYKKVVNYLEKEKQWDIRSDKTKILLLTHRGIAGKLGYQKLLHVYDRNFSYGRDRLFQRDEPFAEGLSKVEDLVFFYNEKRYSEFLELLGKEGFKLKCHCDKVKLKDQMDELNRIREAGTVKQVLDYVFENNLLTKSEKIKNVEKIVTDGNLEDEEVAKKKKFYDELMTIDYSENINLYKYIEDQTPFSTKHGVKGAEYDNVLVVVDDSSWNQYNFNNVLAGNHQNLNRHERSSNLLYVCCSRAKDKLALLALSRIDSNAMATIENWLGQENICDIVDL